MTGNIRFGGTDAKVYIQFKGDKALSEVHRLHNPGVKKEFERGQIDHFHVIKHTLVLVNKNLVF